MTGTNSAEPEQDTPLPPEQQPLTLDELQGFIKDESKDVRLRNTFACLMGDLQSMASQRDQLALESRCFYQGLAVILQQKYAPLIVRTADLEKLPKGWQIQILPGDKTHFKLLFAAPDRDGRIILPGHFSRN